MPPLLSARTPTILGFASFFLLPLSLLPSLAALKYTSFAGLVRAARRLAASPPPAPVRALPPPLPPPLTHTLTLTPPPANTASSQGGLLYTLAFMALRLPAYADPTSALARAVPLRFQPAFEPPTAGLGALPAALATVATPKVRAEGGEGWGAARASDSAPPRGRAAIAAAGSPPNRSRLSRCLRPLPPPPPASAASAPPPPPQVFVLLSVLATAFTAHYSAPRMFAEFAPAAVKVRRRREEARAEAEEGRAEAEEARAEAGG